MITEAFIIKYQDKIAHIQVDRTHPHGHITLSGDGRTAKDFAFFTWTYFEDVDLHAWLKQLKNKNTVSVLTIEVDKNCCQTSNNELVPNRINDVLTIVVKDGFVAGIKDSDGFSIVCSEDSCFIDCWEVGWFGKVFDYYTKNISNNIKQYNKKAINDIWGVFKNSNMTDLEITKKAIDVYGLTYKISETDYCTELLFIVPNSGNQIKIKFDKNGKKL